MRSRSCSSGASQHADSNGRRAAFTALPTPLARRRRTDESFGTTTVERADAGGNLFAGAAGHAQQADRALVLDEQIDRIFKALAYDAPRFGPARWLPDGASYTIVERSAGGAEGSEIAKYDAATGSRTVSSPRHV